MPYKKSPAGAMFPYFFKGGELFGAHYGSFFDDEAGFLARMNGEEAFLLEQNRKLPLWIDFYQTRLTDHILIEFLHSIERLTPLVTRLALVGCSARDKSRFLRLAKKDAIELPMPLRFFSDPEEAKTWLVSESSG